MPIAYPSLLRNLGSTEVSVNFVKVGNQTINLDNVTHWTINPAPQPTQSSPVNCAVAPTPTQPSTPTEHFTAAICFVGKESPWQLSVESTQAFLKFVNEKLQPVDAS